MARLTVDEPRGVTVLRVGYRPEPWAWVGWEWATNGRFSGRWDDRDGNFRTLYVGSTLLACLVEVLANFRPDPHVTLDDITEDEEDRAYRMLEELNIRPRTAYLSKVTDENPGAAHHGV